MTGGGHMPWLIIAGSAALLMSATVARPIDWGSAGSSDSSPAVAMPQGQPEKPKSNFNCDTVTRMSWEQPGGSAELGSGPREVRRCSQDGISMEFAPPAD